MKMFHYPSRFEPAEEKALKEAKKQTGLSINRLLVLSVRRSLPVLCAEMRAKPDPNQKVDWSDLMKMPRRKGRILYATDESRKADRRR